MWFSKLAALVIGVACLSVPAQTLVPSATGSERSAAYILGPDDQISIWARGIDELSDKPSRITPAGDIDLPVAGHVHAAGLTVDQLRATLIQRFSKELLHPEVSVQVVDFGSQPVSIMGAVAHPGVHQLRGRKTLAEVLALAEGLRADAGPRVQITRSVQYGPVPLPGAKADATGQFTAAELNLKEFLAGKHPTANIEIRPYDLITVPAAEHVYVVGEVKKPGEIYLKDRDRISVLEAFASAEGLGSTPAAPQRARILRYSSDSTPRKEVPVDLNKIQAGKERDVFMGPNDILVIPPNGSKKVMARAIEAAIQTATGVAIWRMP